MAGVPATAMTPPVDVEIVGGRLEQVGGDRQDLLTGDERGLANGSPEDGPAPAPAGPEGVGRGVGVALVHRHVLGLDPQVLGDDLGGGRLEPLPVGSRAQVDGDMTVGLHTDLGRLRSVGAHAGLGLDVEPDPEPQAATGVERPRLLDPEPRVVDHRHGLVERLLGGHLRDGHPARHRVGQLGTVHDVATAQFHRVDSDPVGQDVHHLLAGEGLGLPGPPIGRPGAGVRVHRGGPVGQFRQAVGPAEHHDDEGPGASRAHHRVRARVVEVVDVGAEQVPRLVGGQGDGHPFGAGVRGRDQVLVPVLHPLHGAAELVGGQDHHLLVPGDVGLLPEAASDVAHDHPDLVLRHPGDAACGGADVVGGLGGDPDLELPGVAVPNGDDPAGLHGDREVPVLEHGLGDDVGGGVEDPPELVVDRLLHPAAEVVGQLGVDDDVVAAQRLLHVDDGRQRLVLHLNELRRVLGQVAVGGDDQRHRVAHVADVVLGQGEQGTGVVRRKGPVHVADQVGVEVGGGEDGDDPFGGPGGGGVDPGDPGPGDVTAQEVGVQHPGKHDVVEIAAVPGEQAGVLLAPHPLADQATDRRRSAGPAGRRCGGSRRRGSLRALGHADALAAARTALTIPW